MTGSPAIQVWTEKMSHKLPPMLPALRDLGHSLLQRERGCKGPSSHRHLDAWTQGRVDTWTLGHVDKWTLGHLDIGHKDTWTHSDTCENTRNPQDIIKNQCSWKCTRTLREICEGIRNHQGWHLTPPKLIKRDFKKSCFSRFSRFYQHRGGRPPSVVWFRIWGENNWILRGKS